jgi:hypothetical protein
VELKNDFGHFLEKSTKLLKQHRVLKYAFLSDGTPIDNLSQIPISEERIILGHRPPDQSIIDTSNATEASRIMKPDQSRNFLKDQMFSTDSV